MNSEDPRQGTAKGGNSRIGIGTIVLIVVVVILVGVIAFLLGSRSKDTGKAEQEQQERRSVVVNENNADEVVDNMLAEQQKPVDIQYYTATMNYEWYFPDGNSESSNAHVSNSTDNSTDVYFDIFIEGDEENPIYQSPIIPVGSSLDGIKLDKKLDAGNYDCICVYHLVDDEQNTLSTLRVRLTVIVES